MVGPKREEKTVVTGKACIGYSTPEGEDKCGTVYAKEGEKQRTLFAPPSESGNPDYLPEEATVEYRGNKYEANICFKSQEGGRRSVPALCWDVTTEA